MPDLTEAPETTLVGYFARRDLAETACARLRAADDRYHARLGVAGTDGGYAVTLAGLPPGQMQAVRVVLTDAGAERIEDGALNAAQAPRPVQPGFTDAPPGIVPEPADFPADQYEGSGGRFAKQLDDAPDVEDDRPNGG